MTHVNRRKENNTAKRRRSKDGQTRKRTKRRMNTICLEMFDKYCSWIAIWSETPAMNDGHTISQHVPWTFEFSKLNIAIRFERDSLYFNHFRAYPLPCIRSQLATSTILMIHSIEIGPYYELLGGRFEHPEKIWQPWRPFDLSVFRMPSWLRNLRFTECFFSTNCSSSFGPVNSGELSITLETFDHSLDTAGKWVTNLKQMK